MKGVKRSITAEGLNLERFIRLAGERGIVCQKGIRRGRKYTAVVEEKSVPMLAEIAEQGGWKFTVGSRRGAGRYISGAQKHWLLAGLAVAISICLLIASRFMWHITLQDAGTYQADAESYLREIGLHTPMKKTVVSLNELRGLLEWRYPDVAWIDCGWRGTELRITFVHGVPVGEEESIASRDVVASRGGIVESVVTLAGTPVVEAGDVIEAGQVLIQGYERSKDETQTPVSARGIVKVKVWDSASVKVPLYELQTSYTGSTQERRYIKGLFFNLQQPVAPAYEHCDIKRTTMPLGGMFFPFVLCVDEQHEYTVDNSPRPLDSAKSEAEEAAYRLLREKTGFDDDFVDKWVDYCMIEDEEVCAIVYGMRIMDVATYD